MSVAAVETPFECHLAQFDGPMELLLHLLDKNKIDISDIPIVELSDQFTAYLEAREEMNLEVTSHFLVMAAQLVRIKVRMLLPRRAPEEEDPRAPLVAQIMEYRFVKEVAELLAEREAAEAGAVARHTDQAALAKRYGRTAPLLGLDPALLREAFELLAEVGDAPLPDLHLARSEKSIAEWMDEVMAMVMASEGVAFADFFRQAGDRSRLIGLFLALLECIHNRSLMAIQKERFGRIWIVPAEGRSA